MRQVLAHLRSEHLAPQRPEEEIDGALRGGHAAAFNVVGRKDLLQGMRGEHLAQFGPRAAVSLAGAVHAGRHVVPRQGGQGDRIAAQHIMRPVARRNDVEQPADFPDD